MKKTYFVTRSCTPAEREIYGKDTISFEVCGLATAIAMTAGDPNGSFVEVEEIIVFEE